MRIDLLVPDAADMSSFGQLPRAAHKDPFDRIIVWQALRKSRTLISKDPGLGRYREQGLELLW